MYADIWICIISLLASVFIYIKALSFPVSPQAGVPSSSFFPMIVSVGLFVLTGACLIVSIMQRVRVKKTGQVYEESINGKSLLKVAEVVLLMLVYCVLWMFDIGHFLINSLAVFIPICCVYSKERVWWKNAIFVTILVFFIYCLFTFLLRVPL